MMTIHYLNIGKLQHRTECGYFANDIGSWSSIKSHVTCEECIRIMNKEQKPVVDEQKKMFARHIVDYSYLHPKDVEVVEAKQYLESLEGE